MRKYRAFNNIHSVPSVFFYQRLGQHRQEINTFSNEMLLQFIRERDFSLIPDPKTSIFWVDHILIPEQLKDPIEVSHRNSSTQIKKGSPKGILIKRRDNSPIISKVSEFTKHATYVMDVALKEKSKKKICRPQRLMRPSRLANRTPQGKLSYSINESSKRRSNSPKSHNFRLHDNVKSVGRTRPSFRDKQNTSAIKGRIQYDDKNTRKAINDSASSEEHQNKGSLYI